MRYLVLFNDQSNLFKVEFFSDEYVKAWDSFRKMYSEYFMMTDKGNIQLIDLKYNEVIEYREVINE